MNRFLLSLFFILFIIGLIYFVFFSNYLKVRHIVVKLSHVDCVSQESIESQLGLVNKNIILINSSLVERQFKKKYLCLSRLGVVKSYPNSIDILAEGREPALIFNLPPNLSDNSKIKDLSNLALPSESTPSSSSAITTRFDQIKEIDQKFLVDKEGFIYSKTNRGNSLPVINIFDNQLRLGDNFGKEKTTKIIEISKRVKDFSLDVETYVYENNDLALRLKNGQKILFDIEGNTNWELASLQLILQKSKIDSKDYEVIDLRFDKPVVIYSPKK